MDQEKDEIDPEKFCCGFSFILTDDGDLLFDAHWKNEEDCIKLGLLMQYVSNIDVLAEQISKMETENQEDVKKILDSIKYKIDEPAMSPLDVYK